MRQQRINILVEYYLLSSICNSITMKIMPFISTTQEELSLNYKLNDLLQRSTFKLSYLKTAFVNRSGPQAQKISTK